MNQPSEEEEYAQNKTASEIQQSLQPPFIEEPQPDMTGYENQLLLDDNSSSIDNFSNLNKDNQELQNSASRLNDESAKYDDPRDFAEEFTNPLHNSLEDNNTANRLVEMSTENAMTEPFLAVQNEISNEAPSDLYDSSMDVPSPGLDRDDLYESSNDGITSSVAIIHQQHEHNGTDKKTTYQNEEEMEQEPERNDEQNMAEENKENKSESNEQHDNLQEEEDNKGGENENAVSNVLHADDNIEADNNIERESDNEVNDEEEKHGDDALDYGDDEEMTFKEPENHSINFEDGELSKDVTEDPTEETIDTTALSGGEIEENKEILTEVIEPIKPKKIIIPVHLKKRVSLTALNETAEEKSEKRKRRWGSTSIKNSSVTISTESIKRLIPDVKIDPAALENTPELDYQEDGDMLQKTIDDTEQHVDTVEQVTDKITPSKKRRTVKLDSAKTVTIGQQQQQPTEETVVIDSDTGGKPSQKRTVKAVETDDDLDPTKQREKSPSPAKNTPSSYLHIENLVRPFTVNQLRTLIRKTATLDDDSLWINNIKSHAYVILSSEEDSIAVREALHGVNWPSGSPKKLKVDYAIMEQMWRETDGKFGEKPKVVIEIDDKENEKEKPASKEERPARRKSVEEERKKRREQREERERQRKEKDLQAKKDTVREESPAKLLDDLFRKTKATPCIYWLPLTNEQIQEKEKKEREQPKNDRRSPVRRSPVRRSPVRRSPVRRPQQQQQRNDRGWR